MPPTKNEQPMPENRRRLIFTAHPGCWGERPRRTKQRRQQPLARRYNAPRHEPEPRKSDGNSGQ
jgi:hypothetical protein